jgi:hypothetical protein
MPRKLSLKQTYRRICQSFSKISIDCKLILALVDITEGIMLTEAIRILAALTLNGRVLHCMHAEKSFCCEK